MLVKPLENHHEMAHLSLPAFLNLLVSLVHVPSGGVCNHIVLSAPCPKLFIIVANQSRPALPDPIAVAHLNKDEGCTPVFLTGRVYPFNVVEPVTPSSFDMCRN